MKIAAACLFLVLTPALKATVSDTVPPSSASDPIDYFQITEDAFNNLRDPFWPVGFKPASEEEQKERMRIDALQSRIKWPDLKLRGITHASGKTYIAVIENIGLVEPGDIVAIKRDRMIYRWRISRISPEGITSTRLDATEEDNN